MPRCYLTAQSQGLCDSLHEGSGRSSGGLARGGNLKPDYAEAPSVSLLPKTFLLFPTIARGARVVGEESPGGGGSGGISGRMCRGGIFLSTNWAIASAIR